MLGSRPAGQRADAGQVNLLPQPDFARGFGIATPTFKGQCKVLRYHLPYFERHWLRLVELSPPPRDALERLGEIADPGARLASAHKLFGRDVFWAMPCQSTRDPSEWLEGARLTLQADRPRGHVGQEQPGGAKRARNGANTDA